MLDQLVNFFDEMTGSVDEGRAENVAHQLNKTLTLSFITSSQTK